MQPSLKDWPADTNFDLLLRVLCTTHDVNKQQAAAVDHIARALIFL